MKYKYILFAAMTVIMLAGCNWRGIKGSGDLKSVTREIENFDEVEIGGAFDVYIKVGEKTSLEIKGDDNLLQYIRTRVKGNTLEIDTRKNIRPRKGITINITTPDLEKIVSSGASSISAINFKNDELSVYLSGAGSIDLKGETKELHVEMSGAGSLDADNLRAEDVSVSISGACSADVYAINSLDASVSGVGSIDYLGNPTRINSNVSGVGSINRKDQED
ncbi:MAG: head GIN domain-containing protein [bacterium]